MLPEARGQIYHVIRKPYKIIELAETVAQHNPKVRCITTDDAVPFSSYHLSNEKLVKTGYEFQFDLESGVKQMMEKFGQISAPPA